MSERTVLITGATGHQGGAVARALANKGSRLRAMTRKPDSEAAGRVRALGIDVVAGDLDDETSLKSAVAGAWGVFAVQNTWEAGVEAEEVQGKRIASVAKAAGVQHFVYSSVGSADRRTGIPHFDNKFRVEEHVRGLKFPSFVILRPVFFMENLVGPAFLNGGTLYAGMPPTTPLQMIAVDDIGFYGAAAFTQADRLNGRAIDLAGDTRTMSDAARILGQAMGREVPFIEVPIADVRKHSDDLAIMLEWFVRVGYDADIPALEREFAFKSTTLDAWAKTHVGATA
jgi:uncharacterized protein YbjT (DUF2867 family)